VFSRETLPMRCPAAPLHPVTRAAREVGSQGPRVGEPAGEDGALSVAATVGNGSTVVGLGVLGGLGVTGVAHELAVAPTRSAATIEILARAGAPNGAVDLMRARGYAGSDDPSLVRSSGVAGTCVGVRLVP
jgi:hypothetical protein